ncbi:MAG: 16S rRNA (cytosine(967)-C(5))-methyltransferase RsmB [Lachnospiraceae bacterium]|nr:16S rRNA (cytosine(967)-C(5))-methyltransferase RsmB [Lachnospiraceae bacterium]
MPEKNRAAKGLSPRDAVLDILIRQEKTGEKLNELINSALASGKDFDVRDRAFIKHLSEGTVERRITLDHVIDRFSNVKTGKMKPVIRNILRLGTYELLFMDSVPARAVCSTSVELAKKRHFGPLSGFVNAVLRTIDREKPDVEEIEDPSVRYSYPRWIYELFLNEFGEEKAGEIMRLSLGNRPVYLRNNILKQSPDKLQQLLSNEDITVIPVKDHENALEIRDFGDITELKGYGEGLFSVQDISSMSIGEEIEKIIREIEPESFFIIDTCASPGGKSCHAAEILMKYALDRGLPTEDSFSLLSRDVSQNKLERIIENRDRLGLKIMDTEVFDARLKDERREGEKADLIIADLPCSGLGVTGRKNDIKYRLKPEDIISLSELQREILKNTDTMLKKGGYLIFSVCTVTGEETTGQCAWIGSEMGYTKLKEKLTLPGESGADGFYYAVFRK